MRGAKALTVAVAFVVVGTVLAGPNAAAAARQPARRGPINFVGVCRFSHQLPDDPIVFPGQPGASHLHDFFGNTTTNASSTHETLAGQPTTCRIPGETAAYWAPSLYDDGRRVQPTHARVYYNPGGKDHRTIKAPPAGLEVVADKFRWACAGADEGESDSGVVPTCPSGTHLVMRIVFPDCWDGRNLDSADHRGHMAYSRRGRCPSTHPVPLPRVRPGFHYPSDGGNLTLASNARPHADFFNSWNQATLERLVVQCINAGRHCGARPGMR